MHHMDINHAKHFHVKPENFECDFDGRIFKTKLQLKRHIRVHKLKVKCQICNVELQPFYLKIHIREVHAENRKFQCQFCQNNYKSGQVLKYHIQTHNKAFKKNV